VIALAIKGNDKHGASVAGAFRLVRIQDGRGSALRGDVTGTLSETAMAKFVGATEKLNKVVGAVGSEHGLHGAVMLVAQRKKIGPHRTEFSI
jgi:hypothetical protein